MFFKIWMKVSKLKTLFKTQLKKKIIVFINNN